MRDKIKHIERVWLQVGDFISPTALAKTVIITEEYLRFNFPGNLNLTELWAISGAKKFSDPVPATFDYTFTFKSDKRAVRLNHPQYGQNFQISEPDTISARYVVDGADKNTPAKSIEIVPQKSDVKYDDQLSISKDLRVFLAENLVHSKTVRVEVPCQVMQVQALEEPLEEAIAHMVCTWNDDSVHYLKFVGKPEPNPFQKRLMVTLKITGVTDEVLC